MNIALIPGDGIGTEVMPEGVRVLEAAAGKHGFSIDWKEFDWSCETYLATGRMMPADDGQATHDAYQRRERTLQ